METESELLRLLSSVTDGELDEAAANRMQQLLALSKNSECFRTFMKLHFALIRRTAPVRAFSAEELRAVSAVDAKFQVSSPLACTGLHSEKGWRASSLTESEPPDRGRWTWFVGGLAASLLLILPLATYFYATTTESPQPSRGVTIVDQPLLAFPDAAARIVTKIDCEWENDRWMVSSPVSFRAGEWINLNSGLLVLEFQSGAQVTLQGPVEASPISGNAIRLVSGGMSATIPESARGFTVHTNSGDIVDLGTEFGVFAREDGSLETHVFKGEVVTRLGVHSKKVRATRVSITTGQAQLVSATGAARTSPAEPSKFLRYGFGLDAELTDRPPVDRELVLWLAADGRVQLDSRDRVMAWGDNPTDANVSLEDTWQVDERIRPFWDSHALNGKPAIQFGENAKLVSEPIELGSDVSAAVVFRLDSAKFPTAFQRIREFKYKTLRARPDLGLQLLNLDGPPHPVIQINEDLSLTARVHLGWDPNHLYDNDVGSATSSPIVDDMPHIVVYTFDTSRAAARLYLDGALIGEVDGVPPLDPTFTPRYIGQHPIRHFHGLPGHIAEVMVHNAALLPAEANLLSVWLGHKYQIPIASAE